MPGLPAERSIAARSGTSSSTRGCVNRTRRYGPKCRKKYIKDILPSVLDTSSTKKRRASSHRHHETPSHINRRKNSKKLIKKHRPKNSRPPTVAWTRHRLPPAASPPIGYQSRGGGVGVCRVSTGRWHSVAELPLEPSSNYALPSPTHAHEGLKKFEVRRRSFATLSPPASETVRSGQDGISMRSPFTGPSAVKVILPAGQRECSPEPGRESARGCVAGCTPPPSDMPRPGSLP